MRSLKIQHPQHQGREAGTHSHEPFTYDNLLKIGLGELNLDPQELYEYSIEEFVMKMNGVREARNMVSRERWEQTRDIAFTVAQFSGYAKKSLTKYQILQFPWDEKKPKQEISGMSSEDRKAHVKAMFERSNEVWKEFLNNRN